MSRKKENAAVVGVGAAACAVCCAGPILGVLAAIGLGSAAGFALFGVGALVTGALAVVLVAARRRRRGRANICASAVEPVPVELTGMRTGP